jgi:putative transcriptional regulator
MNLTNHFLLALPTLQQDYFAATLTYICEHSADGAMGIVVNQPSEISVFELLNNLGLQPSRRWIDDPVIVGGPVSTDRGFMLYAAEDTYESSLTVTDGVHLTSSLESLRAVADNEGPEQFLIARGYAGWSAGQLESEIARNVWLTVEASQSILFEQPFEQRLDAAAKTLGVELSLVAPEAGYS